MVSYAGLVCALLASVCLFYGAGDAPPWEAQSAPVRASWWPFVAGTLFGISALLDIFDGILARGTGMHSRWGAVLDSTLDRFGDMAVFSGCVLHFAANGNLTFVLISCVAMVATVQISYVKARGENLTSGLGVGFWQRAERMTLLIVGGLLGRIPLVLCMSAVFPMLTVLRRIRLARRLLTGDDRVPPRLEQLAERYAPWRRRRSSPVYLGFGALLAVAIYVLPTIAPSLYGATDPGRSVAGVP